MKRSLYETEKKFGIREQGIFETSLVKMRVVHRYSVPHVLLEDRDQHKCSQTVLTNKSDREETTLANTWKWPCKASIFACESLEMRRNIMLSAPLQ